MIKVNSEELLKQTAALLHTHSEDEDVKPFTIVIEGKEGITCISSGPMNSLLAMVSATTESVTNELKKEGLNFDGAKKILSKVLLDSLENTYGHEALENDVERVLKDLIKQIEKREDYNEEDDD